MLRHLFIVLFLPLLPVPMLAMITLVDPQATDETRALFANLQHLQGARVLFGHQATLAYGHDWVAAPDTDRSDVRDVVGSFPAVYGWDLEDLLHEAGAEANIYQISRDQLLAWCRRAYERGGVLTFSWHMANPVTQGSFYDKTPAAATLLPGAANHAAYCRTLDTVAAFFKDLSPAPIIFRPFHEHNGDWFWWGKGFVSEEDYVALWRFTVTYLRDTRGVHNLLYAFSPDRSRLDLSRGEREYFYAYPGDAYVDILGLDNYWDVGHSGNRAPAEQAQRDFVKSLELVATLAIARHKLAALTETGQDTLPHPRWYTDVLLNGLDSSYLTRSHAYALVWRNANAEVEKREHFYVPYPGHPAAENFRQFFSAPVTAFEDDLPPLYRQPAPSDD